MKENNIEEDIKIVENYLAHSAINETDSDFFKNGGWETVDLEIPKSMQHILSDYKRVLKENNRLEEQVEYDKTHIYTPQTIKLNFISKSKVKDKIEEIQEEGYWLFTTDRDSDKCVEVLQKLLEENENHIPRID